MTTTTLLTVIIMIILTGVAITLVNIFRDKKVTPEEKIQLQKIVLTTFSQVLELNKGKTEEELKTIATGLILAKLQENNIKNVTEITVRNLIDLILAIQVKIADKINPTVTP